MKKYLSLERTISWIFFPSYVLGKSHFFLFLIFWTIEQSQSTGSKEFRSKRESNAFLHSPPLVYPYGGTLKLLVGCAVPISMPGRILSYGQNLQVQYALPQNASFFTDYFNSRRRRRRSPGDTTNERSIFYRLLEQAIPRRNHDITSDSSFAKDCVKRSICESAETPLRDDGLMGEILHVLLTPDYEGSVNVDEEYREAALIGRNGSDCFVSYPSCPLGYGILDNISTVFNLD